MVAETPSGLRPRGGNSDQCRVIRETFDRIGDKWTLLIIAILTYGPQRFTALKDSAEGISQRMLTLTLRKLERDGLVLRTVYPVVPLHVEYQLTELGRTLVAPVQALADWALVSLDQIEAKRAAFDAQAASPAVPSGS
jgi:DNA-binding HxlR family transcriptional regulator